MEKNSLTTARTPAMSLEQVDLNQAAISYDHESDTLMIHLVGRGQPGVSVVVDDHLYLRMDRERKRVLALQIEGFLAAVVPAHPALLNVLDMAELRGISPAEVADLRRASMTGEQKRTAIAEVLSHFVQPVSDAGAA